MSIRDLMIVAWEGVWGYRLRSMLTVLGIVIGVFAVVSLISLGETARRQVAGQIAELGSGLMMVIPGREDAGFSPGFIKACLTLKDAQRLEKIPELELVSPNLTVPAHISSGGIGLAVSCYGESPSFLALHNYSVAEGRFFTNAEMQARAKVAVIGSKVRNQLFENQNPLGRAIRINGITYKVIGVLDSKGRSLGHDQDKIVVVPVTAAQDMSEFRNIGIIFVRSHNTEGMDLAKTKIIETLRKTHATEDFQVVSKNDVLSVTDKVLNTLTALLVSIAAVSLAVGGIGIMNIMLVSVHERTREIGIRRALGATRKDILSQFLAESAILGLIGGLLGIVLSALAFVGLSQWAHWPLSYEAFFGLSPYAILLGLTCALGIGVVFGLYPAAKAARLSPIEALRYE